jgi:uroporphyrin-III C-methyltransferase / precorrin-2 dehydrogenase / sirohydrochlorin ferrochelatase
MRFLPVFLDLTSATIALVGAGPAALNRLRLLRAAGAHVRWLASGVDAAEHGLPAGASAVIFPAIIELATRGLAA